jgi:hypothetical protein
MIHCLRNNTLHQHDVTHEWNKALDWQLFGVVLLYHQGTLIIDVVLRGLRGTCVSMVYPKEQSMMYLTR